MTTFIRHHTKDRVFVRPDLHLGILYRMKNYPAKNRVSVSMLQYAGTWVTISCFSMLNAQYRILEDMGMFLWTDEMFVNFKQGMKL